MLDKWIQRNGNVKKDNYRHFKNFVEKWNYKKVKRRRTKKVFTLRKVQKTYMKCKINEIILDNIKIVICSALTII